MSLSQISMCAAEALYYLSTNNEVTVNTGIVVQNAKLMNAARSWSATTFKITYLEYSYFRTAPILKQAYSDFANPALIAVHVSALFLTLPSFYVTSALWYTMDSNQIAIRNYIALATFVWLLLIDSCFLALFVKCLRSYKDLVEVDSQFLIISRFGIVAGILFCCVIPFTYLYMFFGSEYYYCVCIFLFSTIFIVLFGMKISLHRDTLRKQKELRERINAAKQNTTIGAGRFVFKSQDTMAFDDDNKL
ncbi:hypothetical protein HDU84_000893 [Entophlyctis sp. JEL0112]|nr:hypothetical protein HDU84_000893 [Entophlyctis sp. JEL0112]